MKAKLNISFAFIFAWLGVIGISLTPPDSWRQKKTENTNLSSNQYFTAREILTPLKVLVGDFNVFYKLDENVYGQHYCLWPALLFASGLRVFSHYMGVGWTEKRSPPSESPCYFNEPRHTAAAAERCGSQRSRLWIQKRTTTHPLCAWMEKVEANIAAHPL